MKYRIFQILLAVFVTLALVEGIALAQSSAPTDPVVTETPNPCSSAPVVTVTPESSAPTDDMTYPPVFTPETDMTYPPRMQNQGGSNGLRQVWQRSTYR